MTHQGAWGENSGAYGGGGKHTPHAHFYIKIKCLICWYVSLATTKSSVTTEHVQNKFTIHTMLLFRQYHSLNNIIQHKHAKNCPSTYVTSDISNGVFDKYLYMHLPIIPVMTMIVVALKFFIYLLFKQSYKNYNPYNYPCIYFTFFHSFYFFVC